MKKLILFIGLLTVINGHSQIPGTTGGTVIDSSNDPSGQAFGGAMGGGTTSPQVPSRTTPESSTQEIEEGIPRGNEFPQQSMEDRTNFSGGALGGDTNVPDRTVMPPGTITNPADTPVAPNVPPSGVELPRTNGTKSPTGIGTGNP